MTMSRIVEVATTLGVDPRTVELALDHSLPDRVQVVAVLLGRTQAEIVRRAARLAVDTQTALDWLVLAA